jgi:hypothetical protein
VGVAGTRLTIGINRQPALLDSGTAIARLQTDGTTVSRLTDGVPHSAQPGQPSTTRPPAPTCAGTGSSEIFTRSDPEARPAAARALPVSPGETR